MAERLLDANVALRHLLTDTMHPRYLQALAMLERGGVIRPYVMSEIVFNFLGAERIRQAKRHAISVGEEDIFRQNPKRYAFSFTPSSGWRKSAYTAFQDAMNALLEDYPNVKIEDADLYQQALSRAIETGHDWVDCMLLAEKDFGWFEVCSLDKDVSATAVSEMNLDG